MAILRQGETAWLNEPPEWSETNGVLTLRTGNETDWWNNTFYGFRHLNGHFRGTEITGDFSLEVTFSAPYEQLYDQAGAMLVVNENNWLKCGVEFTDGQKHFSVVVTRDNQSDWSVLPLTGENVAASTTLRLTRHADALRVQVQDAAGTWRFVRLAYLDMPEKVQAGPMACSPTREGLAVRFERVAFNDPISRDLH